MASDSELGGQWDRVAAELRACRESQQKAWGAVDNIALGRYLAGEASREERGEVERALEELPDLRLLTDLVRDVLVDCEPAAPLPVTRAENKPVRGPVPAPVAGPVLLPFPAPGRTRAGTRQVGVLTRLRQRSSLVAAACLLLAFGLLLPHGHGPAPRNAAHPDDALDGALPHATASVRSPGGLRGSPALPGVPAAPGVEAEGGPMLTGKDVVLLEGLNQKMESLLDQGRTTEARPLAHRFHTVLPTHPVRQSTGIQMVSADQDGDLPRADAALRKAEVLCKRALGPTHPTTRHVMRSRANVYQVALNTPCPETPNTYFALTSSSGRTEAHFRHPGWRPHGPRAGTKDAPGGKTALTYMPYANPYAPGYSGAYGAATVTPANARWAPREKALVFRDQITNMPPAEVRRTVVPVLLQRLKEANRPEERVALVCALGDLGPAARDAIPTLTGLLTRPNSPFERRAVLLALGRMGPAARQATPVLLASLDSKSAEDRRCAADALLELGSVARGDVMRGLKGGKGHKKGDALAREVLRRLQGREGRIGIDDEGECFSARALRKGTHDIHFLARAADVEVLVETVPGPAESSRAEGRLRTMGPRAVYVQAGRAGAFAQVVVSQPLAAQGLSAADLTNDLRLHFQRKDYDGGLQAALGRLKDFEQKQGKGPGVPAQKKPGKDEG